MLASLFTLAALAVSVASQITGISTPSGATGAIQCEIYQIAWLGGISPFDIRLLDSTQNTVEEIASASTSSPIPWIVNQPAGETFLFSIHDSTGATASSGQFTIQTSSNSSCLSAAASGASSTAVGSSAANSVTSAAASNASSSISTSVSNAVSSAASSVSRPAGSSSTVPARSSVASVASSAAASAASAASSSTQTSSAFMSASPAGLLGAFVAGLLVLAA
ncbi:hypothetical protein PENSPDRAFT_736828 [Peniophora sp. CONT]|nr:hypothetical protein PENSPDRAFT_736828 [Peniophora sp. CONT]